jgi:hypothetical protein
VPTEERKARSQELDAGTQEAEACAQDVEERVQDAEACVHEPKERTDEMEAPASEVDASVQDVQGHTEATKAPTQDLEAPTHRRNARVHLRRSHVQATKACIMRPQVRAPCAKGRGDSGDKPRIRKGVRRRLTIGRATERKSRAPFVHASTHRANACAPSSFQLLVAGELHTPVVSLKMPVQQVLGDVLIRVLRVAFPR